MTQSEVERALIYTEMPGYILGLDRSPGAEFRFRSHIYKGDFHDPGDPMCPKGWNRGKDEYSIWRNNLGTGICRNCLKNVIKSLTPS